MGVFTGLRAPRKNNFTATDVAQTLSLLRPDSSGRGRHECRRHTAHRSQREVILALALSTPLQKFSHVVGNR
jgi:hypothetical protein